ncbi:MAG: hypothetical protein QG577_1153 [Thermodesulfobacteriota bacterium]|nr:hypothetical protein [Thermodesulfobacteriota bacterium]
MKYDDMSREELIRHIIALEEYHENVIVFWGGKKEFRDTFAQVIDNRDGSYTEEEVQDASIILNTPGAFDDFVELVRDSFDRGGINYVLSEKISSIMQEVADRHGRNKTASIN